MLNTPFRLRLFLFFLYFLYIILGIVSDFDELQVFQGISLCVTGVNREIPFISNFLKEFYVSTFKCKEKESTFTGTFCLDNSLKDVSCKMKHNIIIKRLLVFRIIVAA